MIEGEICPLCEKGKLRKFKEEIEAGLYVDAFKCSKCSEIWYPEDIMKKIEALENLKAEQRHLIKIGNSLAAVIPVQITRKLKLRGKEKIYVREENGEIKIKPSIA